VLSLLHTRAFIRVAFPHIPYLYIYVRNSYIFYPFYLPISLSGVIFSAFICLLQPLSYGIKLFIGYSSLGKKNRSRKGESLQCQQWQRGVLVAKELARAIELIKIYI